MKTKINPAAINPMQLNSMTAQMNMMNSIQKIGKGKRKYSIKLEKDTKKMLAKFMTEAKKQFGDVSSDAQYTSVYNFLNYIYTEAEKKDIKEIKVNFEEFEFLKKMISDSVKGMEKMSFFWYQIIKKLTVKLMLKQYRKLLKSFN